MSDEIYKWRKTNLLARTTGDRLIDRLKIALLCFSIQQQAMGRSPTRSPKNSTLVTSTSVLLFLYPFHIIATIAITAMPLRLLLFVVSPALFTFPRKVDTRKSRPRTLLSRQWIRKIIGKNNSDAIFPLRRIKRGCDLLSYDFFPGVQGPIIYNGVPIASSASRILRVRELCDFANLYKTFQAS